MRTIMLWVAALAVCACSEDATTSAPTSVPSFSTSASVTVGAGNALAFSPRQVDIAAGGTVTWTWAADNTMQHDVTSGDQPPRFAASPRQTSGSHQATFPVAGTYIYYCTVHGTPMNGVVKVH